MSHSAPQARKALMRPGAICVGLLGTLIVLVALALASTTTAATFTVTNTNDSGNGSLRARISQANSGGDAYDTIVIQATGTIQLTQDLPDLTSNLTIIGPGAGALTVEGLSNVKRVFDIPAPGGVRVQLRGMTIQRGHAGIVNDGGHLEILNSVVRYAYGSGGIVNASGYVLVSSSTVTQNTCSQLLGSCVTGGAIANSGTATIWRSTVNANYKGPAINNRGPLTLFQSTVSGNAGSGIANYDTATIKESTLNLNGGYNVANGDVQGGPPAAISLKSTILRRAKFGKNCNSNGTITSLGYNLANDAMCQLNAAGDQPSTSPQLLPLANYGGPTKTAALSPSSPAVDAGLSSSSKTKIDQRGLPRIVDYPGVPKAPGGDNSDIGSFELQAP